MIALLPGMIITIQTLSGEKVDCVVRYHNRRIVTAMDTRTMITYQANMTGDSGVYPEIDEAHRGGA